MSGRMRRPRCSSCGRIIQPGNEGFGGWVWANTPSGESPWTKIEVCSECTPQAVLDLATAVRKARPKRHRVARRDRALLIEKREQGKTKRTKRKLR